MANDSIIKIFPRNSITAVLKQHRRQQHLSNRIEDLNVKEEYRGEGGV